MEVIINDNTGYVVLLKNAVRSDNPFEIYDHLEKNIPWKNTRVVLLGKTMTPERKECKIGDLKPDGTPRIYRYAGTSDVPLGWDVSPIVSKLREIITSICDGYTFNYCLMQYYYSNTSMLGWHADSIKDLKPGSLIASLSLGTSRFFYIKPNKKISTDLKLDRHGRYSILLNDGDLLLMDTVFNKNYKHMLQKKLIRDGLKIARPGRINLTFRDVAS